MMRISLGTLLAVAATGHAHPGVTGLEVTPFVWQARQDENATDVRAVFAAVRGLPTVACALASRGVSGWGDWGMSPPVSPLGDAPARVRGISRGRLTDEQVTMAVDSLSTADPCVREVALRVLAHVRGERVEARLVARLTSDGPAALREAAAAALGYVGSHLGVDPLLRALRAPETGLRANAAWSLGRIGDTKAAPGVRRLLGDAEPVVRDAAAQSLGHMEDEDSVDELLRMARTDRVARVRRVAAWALGVMEAREVAAGLAEAARTERDEDVREMLVWALGSMEAATAVPTLVDLLRRDPSAEVREEAAWALGAIEDAAAGPALGEAAGGDRAASARATAAWALGQLELRRAPDGLLRALGDADADVRQRAAWAASEIRDPRTVSALKNAFTAERDPDARKAQLRALVRVGDKSEPFFRDLLRHEDAAVREQAVRAIAGRGVDPWPWPMPRPRPFP